MSNASPCSVATLAKLFNITKRRVQQLAQVGVLPKTSAGEYDLIGSVQGYMQFLLDKASRSKDPYPETALIERERLRLFKAKADKAEDDNYRSEGTVLSLEEVHALHTEIALTYASSLEALPGRLAHALIHIEDPALIKTILQNAVREIRRLTSERLTALTKACLPPTQSPDPNTGSVGR